MMFQHKYLRDTNNSNSDFPIKRLSFSKANSIIQRLTTMVFMVISPTLSSKPNQAESQETKTSLLNTRRSVP
jgi:hypothetical protein